jgi:hypothetical protein
MSQREPEKNEFRGKNSSIRLPLSIYYKNFPFPAFNQEQTSFLEKGKREKSIFNGLEIYVTHF